MHQSPMRRLLTLFILVSLGCVSKPKARILDQAEMDRLGLKGVIYDAPLCPIKVNDKKNGTFVNGPCEAVTCLQNGSQLECRAKPLRKL